ncbi:hypothetical protein PB1_01980 [Bacillus methanolicus PB1]|uniref:DUF4349 domain-containing protein n=1 Tax=Bacillus methanolicus PB1 TaxID=997296 RepID=I3E5A0_BACMT|nr:DUF4349 domain-containing protein [Bacillus methanolicus]EIJ81671.1 hypothetical protein PB1_01980 [Bacillus methanolicus PB1]
MKLKQIFYLFILLIFIFSGCSSNSGEKKSEYGKMASPNSDAISSQNIAMQEKVEETAVTAGEETNNKAMAATERMVIYYAELNLRVKDFNKAQKSIEEKAKKYGGYIVDSNVFREGKRQIEGTLMLRIPEVKFDEFLRDVQGEAVEVLLRHVSGQDVTEEYVDLESRLRSKKAVEERLLEFMKNAQKTEDLLKISTDLSKVQEEIEQLKGRIKYYQNQTAFSTVTISLYEDKIVIPEIKKEDLNTWERTKKQFAESLNLLLTAISGMTVFIFGNLPILLLIVLAGIGGYLIVKKYKKKGNHRQE